MSQHLEFKTEKGASWSSFVAILFIALLVGWMGSGVFLPSKAEEDGAAPARAAVAPVLVAVRESTAAPVMEVFVAEGQATPERDTALRTETGGTVAQVLIEKGDSVEAGQVLARIDAAQRQADLERARAEITRTERDLVNARALLERGVATRDRVLAAESAFAAAEAALALAEESLGTLDVTAPFAGRIEAFDLQVGEFVSPGVSVGRIVDLDPLSVTISVPQQAIGDLQSGQEAEVSFITGDVRPGTLGFIGTSADAQTRTFDAEITVANPDGEIPAGLSANIRIPTAETQAHFLSPAILSLDARGTLGIKTIEEGNVVGFYPVTILRAQTDGVWVTGLPERATIITVGQGFVNAGEVVNPQAAELLDGAADELETDQ